MRKPFTSATVVTLLLIAIAHLMRLSQGWNVSVAGVDIAAAVSTAAAAVCVVLAIGTWREMQDAERTPRPAVPPNADAPAPRPADVTPQRRPLDLQVRRPAAYFMFASNGLSPQSIRSAAETHGHIMVGFDAGNIPPAALRAARNVGAELAIYVEGPGGPTGNRWSADERRRIEAAAHSIGIDTRAKTWMKAWDDGGWKTYTLDQLESFKRDGFEACEVDNLDRVLGEGAGRRIAFYQEYGRLHAEGRLPRLLMKNLSEEMLEAVVAAIEDGALPRDIFSEFHISETGSGDRRKQDALTQRIGIRTLASNDTHNYAAAGRYGLEQRFASLLAAEHKRRSVDEPAATRQV